MNNATLYILLTIIFLLGIVLPGGVDEGEVRVIVERIITTECNDTNCNSTGSCSEGNVTYLDYVNTPTSNFNINNFLYYDVASGHFGIGTPNPQELLHIHQELDDTIIRIQSNNTFVNYIQFWNETTDLAEIETDVSTESFELGTGNSNFDVWIKAWGYNTIFVSNRSVSINRQVVNYNYTFDVNGDARTDGNHTITGNLTATNNVLESCAWEGDASTGAICSNNKIMAGYNNSNRQLYCCEI